LSKDKKYGVWKWVRVRLFFKEDNSNLKEETL
jgi:hypothetical protein